VAKVKDAGSFERIITLSVDEEAIEAAKRPAAKRLAGEIKIKGFRPGKAPLKVVESAVGAAALRREAIDDALPSVLTDALKDADLEPAVTPRLIDIRDTNEGAEVDVRVTVWPTASKLPKYKGRKVELNAPDVDDAAVEDQIERMRNQFADLDDVDREAFDGDFVIVDVTTTKDGDEFAAGSATDMLFEVGAGMFLEGMDDALRGNGAGSITEFTSVLPPTFGDDGGAEVSVRVLVKQVKAKRLPELTDEWVDDMTEFETVAEMRTELVEQMERVRRQSLRADFERLLLEQVVEDLNMELPEDLISGEMDSVLHRFAHRLEQQGIEFEQYLALTGQTQEAFIADLRSQAELNLKTRILLEGVGAAEEIEVGDDELEEAVAALAAASDMEPEAYRQALAEGGQENTLSGDILRRKAVDRLLELAVPVDRDGNEIDVTIEEPASEGAADVAAGDGPEDGLTSDAMSQESSEPQTQNRPNDDGQEPAEVDE
jgi:trigger factor